MIRNWTGASGTDLNSFYNYSGSGVLLAVDDIVFNSGNISAIATSDIDINSITSTANYSGVINTSGFIINSNTSVNLNHSGQIYLGDINILNSGDLTIGSNLNHLNNMNLNDSNISMCDNGTLYMNKPSGYFQSISLAYPNKMNYLSIFNGYFLQTNMLNVNGGSYIQTNTSNTFRIIMQSGVPTPLKISKDSYIKIESTTSTINIIYDKTDGTDLSIYIPDCYIRGSGILMLNKSTVSSGNCTYNLVGDLYVPQLSLRCDSPSSGDYTFNSNGHTITVTADTTATPTHFNNGNLGLVALNTTNNNTFNFSGSLINVEWFSIGSVGAVNSDINLTDSIMNISGGYYAASYSTSNKPRSIIKNNSVINILSSGTIGTKLTPLGTINIATGGAPCTFSDGAILDRLKINSGNTCVLKALSGYVINDYRFGDWENCTIRTTVSGNASIITNPANMKVYGVNFRDVTLSQPIQTYSCVNKGNTTNLIFASFTIIPKKISSIFRRFLRR